MPPHFFPPDAPLLLPPDGAPLLTPLPMSGAVEPGPYAAHILLAKPCKIPKVVALCFQNIASSLHVASSSCTLTILDSDCCTVAAAVAMSWFAAVLPATSSPNTFAAAMNLQKQ